MKSISDRKCPDVIDNVSDKWLKNTCVSGAQIAVTVGTEQAINNLNEELYTHKKTMAYSIYNCTLWQ